MTFKETGRSFLRWTRNFVDAVPAEEAGAADAASETPIPEDARAEVLQRYRELAYEIASHLRYESELRTSVGDNPAVKKSFDAGDYSARLVSFLREQGLMRPLAGDVSFAPAALAVLHPTRDIRELVPMDLRRRFFNDVLQAVAAGAGTTVADVAKRYYEHVMHNGVDLEETDQQMMLELLRDALRELDVNLQQLAQSSATPTIDDNAVFALLEDITRGLGLRREGDLKRLFKGGAVVGGLITELILFLGLVGLLLFGPQIAEVTGAGVSAIVDAVGGGGGVAAGGPEDGAPAAGAAASGAAQLAPGVLAAVFAVMMAVVGARTAARSVRRRALVRGVTAVAQNLDVDPETIRRFFQRRFGYEWRKLG